MSEFIGDGDALSVGFVTNEQDKLIREDLERAGIQILKTIATVIKFEAEDREKDEDGN